MAKKQQQELSIIQKTYDLILWMRPRAGSPAFRSATASASLW
jgi:hypothetical protein